jgi:hypothetical protein
MAPYRELFSAPNSPINTTVAPPIEAFVAEPFYQLLRYQLMARQAEVRKADVIESASVLYVYVPENRSLRRVIVPEFRELGTDVFEVWVNMLKDVNGFIPATMGTMFAKAIEAGRSQLAGWSAYQRERYSPLGS